MKVLEGIELKVQQVLKNNIDNHQSIWSEYPINLWIKFPKQLNISRKSLRWKILENKFCLGLQLEYINNEILVHQIVYTEKGTQEI